MGHYLSEMEGDPYGFEARSKRQKAMRDLMNEKLKPLGLTIDDFATFFQTKSDVYLDYMYGDNPKLKLDRDAERKSK